MSSRQILICIKWKNKCLSGIYLYTIFAVCSIIIPLFVLLTSIYSQRSSTQIEIQTFDVVSPSPHLKSNCLSFKLSTFKDHICPSIYNFHITDSRHFRVSDSEFEDIILIPRKDLDDVEPHS